MSVFTFHGTENAAPEDVVRRAFAPNPAPDSKDIVIEQCWGPPLIRCHTLWWKWNLKDKNATYAVPIGAGQSETIDESVDCNSGIVAQIAGTTTTYVAVQCANRPLSFSQLLDSVVQASLQESTAPEVDEASPIPGEISDLCELLVRALGEENPDRSGLTLRVFSTLTWVQVMFDEIVVLVTPAEEGIRVEYVTEVYVDVSPDSDTNASNEAKDHTRWELEPRLRELGFQRDTGHCFTEEMERHSGADVVGWNATLPDVNAVAEVINSLRSLENPVRNDLTED